MTTFGGGTPCFKKKLQREKWGEIIVRYSTMGKTLNGVLNCTGEQGCCGRGGQRGKRGGGEVDEGCASMTQQKFCKNRLFGGKWVNRKKTPSAVNKRGKSQDCDRLSATTRSLVRKMGVLGKKKGVSKLGGDCTPLKGRTGGRKEGC